MKHTPIISSPFLGARRSLNPRFPRWNLYLANLLLVFLLTSCGLPARIPETTSSSNATAPQTTPNLRTGFPTTSPQPDIVQAAQSFVDEVARGEYTVATSRYDVTMKDALPAEQLEKVWEQVNDQAGANEKQLGTTTDQVQGYRRVHVLTQFEKAVIDILVVFNAEGEIAGLFFQPGQAPVPTQDTYRPPGYVSPSSFQEREVVIGSGEWALPGTLALPVGSGPFPAVVLVHGSGPQDRDESIGPNKPFRDLAWGLASRGIGVLRYEKRTKAHPEKFTPEVLAKLTVEEETVADALSAVNLLQDTPGIDPEQIFVAGHSLGAMLAPRIGQEDPSIAGLILLAGPSRTMEDLILEQLVYLSNLDGSVNEQEQTDLAIVQTQVAWVKDPALEMSTLSSKLPLGIPASYWLDLRGYDPVALAKDLEMPLLILQGGRDYQVSPDRDFAVWKRGFNGNERATTILYPALNHLFFYGSGTSTPDEYLQEGHVDEAVINDIAAWIKQH